jgi:hypothetical protein
MIVINSCTENDLMKNRMNFSFQIRIYFLTFEIFFLVYSSNESIFYGTKVITCRSKGITKHHHHHHQRDILSTAVTITFYTLFMLPINNDSPLNTIPNLLIVAGCRLLNNDGNIPRQLTNLVSSLYIYICVQKN